MPISLCWLNPIWSMRRLRCVNPEMKSINLIQFILAMRKPCRSGPCFGLAIFMKHHKRKRTFIAPPRDMAAGWDCQCRAHHHDVFSGDLDDGYDRRADRGPLDARGRAWHIVARFGLHRRRTEW